LEQYFWGWKLMGIDLCYPAKQSLEEHCLNVKLMAMTSVTLGSRVWMNIAKM
jgi:hypothetical protein